jgi:imidazolonepropionase
VTAIDTIDCGGRWITPGLIDCHTHLVYAGDRAREFELCLTGASYEAVARAGGGIVSSVNATRRATEAELVAASLPRLDRLLAEGVTTIEIKSGYGLDLDSEAKQLRAARALATQRRVEVATTFLGAHALPPEAGGDKDRFIAAVCDEMLAAIAAAGLADAVDGFCEGIAFSPQRIELVFAAAKRHGLPVKLHADQLSNLGGAALAAAAGALSADHLEYTDGAGAVAMARAGTVAVLLPGAFYFIRETRVPPVGLFRRHGVGLALATDSNPGTSPLTSLLLTMNMAATLVSPDRRGMPPRRDARSRPRARTAARHRHARSWQMVRPCHLGHQPARRVGVPHRLQPAAPPHLARPVMDCARANRLGLPGLLS